MKTLEERIADLEEAIWIVGIYALAAGFLIGYGAHMYINS